MSITRIPWPCEGEETTAADLCAQMWRKFNNGAVTNGHCFFAENPFPGVPLEEVKDIKWPDSLQRGVDSATVPIRPDHVLRCDGGWGYWQMVMVDEHGAQYYLPEGQTRLLMRLYPAATWYASNASHLLVLRGEDGDVDAGIMKNEKSLEEWEREREANTFRPARQADKKVSAGYRLAEAKRENARLLAENARLSSMLGEEARRRKGAEADNARLREALREALREIDRLDTYSMRSYERCAGIVRLENVEEFRTWGPLDHEGRPIKAAEGETFRAWVRSLRRLGYAAQFRELRACDYGAPTIRKRLFMIARCDGLPIVWPEPTHGPGRGKPWRTAAECIDWSIPCPSIFERQRPLAENTLRRIAEGIRRYVLGKAVPFIVGIDQQGARSAVWNPDAPLSTIVTKGKHALVSPLLVGAGGPSYGGKPVQADKPFGTLMTENHQAVVAAFLAKHYGGVVGHGLEQPIGSVTTVDHHSLVAASLVGVGGRAGQSRPRGADEPMATGTAKGDTAVVAAFLTKYYGQGVGQPADAPAATVTTKDRMGLVTVMVQGQPYVIADIGMRMLQPRELYRAQGFPDSYVINLEHEGRALSKSDQVRLCGNSVCPPMAAALVRANYASGLREERDPLPLLAIGER